LGVRAVQITLLQGAKVFRGGGKTAGQSSPQDGNTLQKEEVPADEVRYKIGKHVRREEQRRDDSNGCGEARDEKLGKDAACFGGAAGPKKSACMSGGPDAQGTHNQTVFGGER